MKRSSNRIFKNIALILVTIFLVASIVNLQVTTRKGINYQVYNVRIPLYLKLLDFFDRHYNYIQLSKSIYSQNDGKEERIMKILQWTYNNIKKAPEGLPVVDDHIWYTIIRGYGVNDQFQDIFTTLCNYAGLEAGFYYLCSNGCTYKSPFSFVKLYNQWFVFDAYRGVYFLNRTGKLASLEEIRAGNWQVRTLATTYEKLPDYLDYLVNLPESVSEGLTRPKIQSPLMRLIFEAEKRLGLRGR